MHRSLRRRWLVVVVACSATLAIGGVAYASIPDSNGVIHVCYVANGSGTLNVYDPTNTDGSVPTSCVKGQASLSFNQTGPVGPQGPQGPVGHLPAAAVATLEQNLAQIQSRLSALTRAIARDRSQQRKQRAVFRTLMQRLASAKTVSAQLAAQGKLSDQTSLALQGSMDRHSKLLTMISNLLKKFEDTEQGLTVNLK